MSKKLPSVTITREVRDRFADLLQGSGLVKYRVLSGIVQEWMDAHPTGADVLAWYRKRYIKVAKDDSKDST